MQFVFIPRQDSYTRYPDSIFGGLAQIGGFFGIIQLISFVSIYHEKKFDKEIITLLHKHAKDTESKSLDLKELLSI